MDRSTGDGKVMRGPLLIREWSADAFHQRVLELETRGYSARRETYRITPEMNPETGEIIHLYTIEMFVNSEAAADSE
jgi:hypothetical protein